MLSIVGVGYVQVTSHPGRVRRDDSQLNGSGEKGDNIPITVPFCNIWNTGYPHQPTGFGIGGCRESYVTFRSYLHDASVVFIIYAMVETW